MSAVLAVSAAIGCGNDAAPNKDVNSAGTTATTSTTVEVAPRSTTAKTGPVATTKPGASKKDADPQFCAWVKAQQNSGADKSDFAAYYTSNLAATSAVREHVPSDVAADHATIEKAFQAVKPAVDSGEVTSQAKFSQWLTKNDPALFGEVELAIQRVATYTKAHC